MKNEEEFNSRLAQVRERRAASSDCAGREGEAWESTANCYAESGRAKV